MDLLNRGRHNDNLEYSRQYVLKRKVSKCWANCPNSSVLSDMAGYSGNMAVTTDIFTTLILTHEIILNMKSENSYT